jgi:hypothetical protein
MKTQQIITINGQRVLAKFPNKDVMAGTFEPMPQHPLKVGDVYVDPDGDINSLLLVQAVYVPLSEQREAKIWALLGIGLSPNSNEFYSSLHTLEEIEFELLENGMQYSHNVQDKVICYLVLPKPQKVSICP